MDYSKHVSTKTTPQMQPTLGKDEVKNSAGGYVFAVDAWTQLDRFLILGSESGTYYATEQKLTIENAKAVEKLIATDGVRVVNRVVEISDAGRAPKNDPALFVLAMAAKLGNDETRKAALQVLPKVARIGTHLFHFAQFVEAFGGWGRGLRTAVANWYNEKPIDKLVMQALKYQSRDGWSHRDLLRLSHAKAPSSDYNELYKYIVDGELKENMSDRLRVVRAVEEMKHLTEVKDVVSYIVDFGLPREVVPTQFLNSPKVWEALLDKMGVEAMVRNLGKMTSVGLIAPMSAASKLVAERLNNAELLQASRLHPMKLLVAMNTYAQGHGVRGGNSWSPDARIVNALDSAFYKSFKFVEPTGKRHMLALDVSGSMHGPEIAGMTGITPHIGSGAMALVTAAIEQDNMFIAFTSEPGKGYGGMHGGDTGVTQLNISPRQRLDDVLKVLQSLHMGGTDCALPMLYAAKHNIPVDTFCVYTDSETWAGKIKPFQALKQYRDKTGIPAKLVVVGMVSNGFTIADPSDAGMIDIIGFDTATPSVIADFSKQK